MAVLKEFLKRTFIFRILAIYRRYMTGFKHLELRAMDYRCDRFQYHDVIEDWAGRIGAVTLVETGTHIGNTPLLFNGMFQEIYTIELSPKLYQIATRRLKQFKNIKLYRGTSEEKLQIIGKLVRTPCVVWLDAHYSSGATALGKSQTPVVSELEEIYRSFPVPRLILIDDAKDFNGSNGYPTLSELKVLVQNLSHGKAEVIIDRGVIVLNEPTHA